MSDLRTPLDTLVAVAAAAGFISFGISLRVHFLPRWTGPDAWVADSVSTAGLFVLTMEALGAVNGLRRPMLLLAGMLWGAAAWMAARGRANGHRSGVTLPPGLGVPAVMATAAVAQWASRSILSSRRGIGDVDSLHYHLPFAARWVQDASVTALHFTRGTTQVATFHPANAELVHAAGMILLGDDTASPFINIGWLALTLLAAWSIGETRNVGAASVVGATVVLTSPVIALTQAGTAATDIPSLFFLLAAIALGFRAQDEPVAWWFAGAAAGLAVGTKLTMVAPVAILIIAATMSASREARGRRLIQWCLPVLALGGFWYVRNALHTGSPVPALHLGVFPSPDLGIVETYGFPVVHYAARVDVWREHFAPGLRTALGWAWPAQLTLAAAGVVLAARGQSSRWERVLGLTALGGFAAYTITPLGAAGPDGTPLLFAVNLRYLAPILLIALVLLPLTHAASATRWRRRLCAAALIGCVISTLTTFGPWSAWAEAGRANLAGSALAVAGLGLVSWVLCNSGKRPVATALAVAGVAVASLLVADPARHQRYAGHRSPLESAYAWAQPLKEARIGIVGFFTQYPLYGRDLSNHVMYIGGREPHGGFGDHVNCGSWKAAVNHAHLDYVVTGRPETVLARFEAPDGPPAAAAWTRHDRHAREVLRNGPVSVFKIEGRLDPNACTDSPDLG